MCIRDSLPGLMPYLWTRIANKEKVFNTFEWVVVGLVIVGAIAAVVGLANGSLVLE